MISEALVVPGASICFDTVGFLENKNCVVFALRFWGDTWFIYSHFIGMFSVERLVKWSFTSKSS